MIDFGLLATRTAALIKARYGVWPEYYARVVGKHGIPPEVIRMAERFARERPWERP